MIISPTERMKAKAFLACSKVTILCKGCVMSFITPKTRGNRPNCKECVKALKRFDQVVEYMKKQQEPSGAAARF